MEKYEEIARTICDFFNEDYNIVIDNSKKINGHTSMTRGFCILFMRGAGATNADCLKITGIKYKRGIQKIRSKMNFLVNNDLTYKNLHNEITKKIPT